MNPVNCKIGDRVRIPKFSALFVPGGISPNEDTEQAKVIYIVKGVKPCDVEDNIRNYGKDVEGLCSLDLIEEATGECFIYLIDNSQVELIEEVAA